MLDLAFIRENVDTVKAAVKNKREKADIDAIIAADEKRRAFLKEVEVLRQKRNEVSKEIGMAKKKGLDAEPQMAAMREVGDRIKAIEEGLAAVEAELNDMLRRVPNVPAADVVVGPEETHNREVRAWGEKPKLDFTPLPHWELAERLGLVDFARGTKIAGSGFILFTGLGARLERALVNFMLDMHTRSTATGRSSRRSSSTATRCSARASSRSSKTTCTRPPRTTSSSSRRRRCPSPTSTATRS